MSNHNLMVFGRECVDLGLEEEFVSRGWSVRVVDLPDDDADEWLDAITDAMAVPASPARAVMLGVAAAAAALAEFADRHPERAIALVVDSAGQAVAELPCPVLALGSDPAKLLAALEPIVAELDRSASEGTGRPAPPPALTPALLNDVDVMGRLREMCPVHRVDVPAVASTWILTGYDATTDAMADPALIGESEITAGFRLQGSEPGVVHRGEADLVTIAGEEHARLRRLVGRYLTPSRVATLRPRIQDATDAMLDELPTGEVVDLLAALARPLPIVILCELLGIPAKDRKYIYDWLVVRMSAMPPTAHDDIDEYLRSLIVARRSRPTDDLLGWVVRAEGDRLSEEDLIAAARLLMVGGHRAPTTLLANGIAALLRDREQWQRLVSSPELIDPAVEELLRFVTPFPVGLARHVNKPLTVDNVLVPAGDLLAASLVAANRDPSIFPEPDVLDVGRQRNPHLAFGQGHHYCLGAALARVQAQVAIGTLANRFPDMDIAQEAQLHYRQSRVRYLLRLPVVFQPNY